MNIQAGKRYETRGGRSVRIYAIDGGGDYPVHGAIKDSDEDWVMWAWDATGRACPEDGPYPMQNDDDDLVAEETDVYAVPNPQTYALWTGNRPGKNYIAEALSRLTHYDVPWDDQAYEAPDQPDDHHPLYQDKPKRWED